jgi:hypothetical protein
MKRLTCTCDCGKVLPAKWLHGVWLNCTCPHCGKEYYYLKSLGKWLDTYRVHATNGKAPASASTAKNECL